MTKQAIPKKSTRNMKRHRYEHILTHRCFIKRTQVESIIYTQRNRKGKSPKIPFCKTTPIPDNDCMAKNLRLDWPGI